MAKSLEGPDFDAALEMDIKAQMALWSSTRDLVSRYIQQHAVRAGPRNREIALKYRLGFYSYLLGLEADQVAGELAFRFSGSSSIRHARERRATRGEE